MSQEEEISNGEEEIFKTLGHKVRREIIKIVGTEEKVTFSEIKKSMGTIDSPALSYHLKFLQPLIEQKEGKYLLNNIGLAAFNLLTKTDESVKISKYKKNFTYAHTITVVCWAITSLLVPYLMSVVEDQFLIVIFIIMVLSGSSAVNGTLIGILRTKY